MKKGAAAKSSSASVNVIKEEQTSTPTSIKRAKASSKEDIIGLRWTDIRDNSSSQHNLQPGADVEIIVTSQGLPKSQPSPGNYLFKTHTYRFTLKPNQAFLESFSSINGPAPTFSASLKLFIKNQNSEKYEMFLTCDKKPSMNVSFMQDHDTGSLILDMFFRKYEQPPCGERKPIYGFTGNRFRFLLTIFWQQGSTMQRVLAKSSTGFQIASKPDVYFRTLEKESDDGKKKQKRKQKVSVYTGSGSNNKAARTSYQQASASAATASSSSSSLTTNDENDGGLNCCSQEWVLDSPPCSQQSTTTAAAQQRELPESERQHQQQLQQGLSNAFNIYNNNNNNSENKNESNNNNNNNDNNNGALADLPPIMFADDNPDDDHLALLQLSQGSTTTTTTLSQQQQQQQFNLRLSDHLPYSETTLDPLLLYFGNNDNYNDNNINEWCLQ